MTAIYRTLHRIEQPYSLKCKHCGMRVIDMGWQDRTSSYQSEYMVLLNPKGDENTITSYSACVDMHRFFKTYVKLAGFKL